MKLILAGFLFVCTFVGAIPLSTAASFGNGIAITITIDANTASFIRQWRRANNLDSPSLLLEHQFANDCRARGANPSRMQINNVDTQYCI